MQDHLLGYGKNGKIHVTSRHMLLLCWEADVLEFSRYLFKKLFSSLEMTNNTTTQRTHTTRTQQNEKHEGSRNDISISYFTEKEGKETHNSGVCVYAGGIVQDNRTNNMERKNVINRK